MNPSRLRSSLPLLFGLDARNRLLVSLAVEGAAHKRALSKRTGIDHRQLCNIVTHFQKIGVVEVKRGYAAPVFLREFFASRELESLLLRLGGVKPHPLSRNDRHVPKQIDLLFGGRTRTAILMHLAVLGPVLQQDLARLIGADPRGVKHASEHLRRERVVNVSVNGRERTFELNAEFEAAEELRALLSAIAARLLNVESLRAMHREIVERRAEAARPSDTPHMVERLLPFGKTEQSRLLIEIARRDVATTGDLAVATGWSYDCVSGVGESLLRHRLIQRRTIGSGPQRKQWIALDPRHPLHGALRQFARVVAGKPVSRKGPRPANFPELGPTYTDGEIPRCLPGERTSNGIMLQIARARFHTDERRIVQGMGDARWRIRRWLHLLHGAGLIVYDARSGDIQMNRDQLGAPEIRALLAVARKFAGEGAANGRHECRRARGP